MALRKGFHGRSRSQKRITAWGLGPNAVDLVFSATGSQVWTFGSELATEDRTTIVRIRGNAHVLQTGGDVAGTGFAGAIGIGIVSKPAFTAGIVSMPTPTTDLEWPGWMYHRFFDTRVVTGTIGDGVNAAAVSQSFEIDTKAMRKFGTDEVLFGAIEVVERGVGNMEFHADSRILVKLA